MEEEKYSTTKKGHFESSDTLTMGQEMEQPPYPPSPNKTSAETTTTEISPRRIKATVDGNNNNNNTAAATSTSAPDNNKPRQTTRTPGPGNNNNKPRHTTRRWSAEEDEQLTQLVANSADFHKISWAELASHMTNRSAKQCRERYINSLRPDTKKGLWTEEEDESIIKFQAVLGNQWSKIAAMLPGRSDNDVKNRWHSKMRSKAVKRKEQEWRSNEQEWRRSVINVSRGGVSSENNNANYNSRGNSNNTNGNVMHTAATAAATMQEPKRPNPTPVGELTTEMDSNYTKCTTNALPEGRAKSAFYGDDDSQNPIFNGIRSTTSLSEVEVTLCHQLLNLQRTLQTKQPDAQQQKQQQSHHFQAATYHYGEEQHNNNNKNYYDEDYLVEHVQSMKSRDWTEKKNGSSRHHHHHRDHDIETNAAKSYVAIGAEESKRRKSGGVSNKTALPVKRTNSSIVRKRSSSPSTASAKKKNPRKKQIEPPLNSPPCTVATSDPNALSGIRHPRKHDCLIGRGGGTNHHPGNIKFRLLIEKNKSAYKNSKRECKPLLAVQIVKKWRAMDPPGRFLKLNEQTGLWDDIGNEASRIKCSQTLREKKVSKLQLADVGCEEEEDEDS